MLGRQFVTVSEAALLLGVSQQAVHRACRVGRIRFEVIGGVRVLQREGLAARWHGSSQRRRMIPVEPEPDLVAIAERANAYLDCSAWGPPPFSADQWQTLQVVMEMAGE